MVGAVVRSNAIGRLVADELGCPFCDHDLGAKLLRLSVSAPGQFLA